MSTLYFLVINLSLVTQILEPWVLFWLTSCPCLFNITSLCGVYLFPNVLIGTSLFLLEYKLGFSR